MSKEATDRYNTRVEVPIIILLETIFSSDNRDVESIARWAKKYGFIDLIEDYSGNYYKLQDDYNKQDFYILLDKEERKQYDYENYLLDEIERLNNIINEFDKWLDEKSNEYRTYYEHDKADTLDIASYKLEELKGGNK